MVISPLTGAFNIRYNSSIGGKDMYRTLLAISILCLMGECDSIITLIMWDTLWFIILMVSVHKLQEESSND